MIKHINSLAMVISLLAFPLTGLAQTDPVPELWKAYPRLNEISLQVSAEQWATTKTARVVVGVDASLDQAGLDKLQSDVVANLNKMAKETEWRITVNQRSQEQSELEKVHLEVEARVAESDLTSLRSKARALTKPGVKYTIITIDYTPTLAEMETVRDQLRQTIYRKITNELAGLNKAYPDQTYYVHQITFNSADVAPAPMAYARSNVEAMAAMPMAKQAVNNSNNLVMTADVVIASTIRPLK